MKIVDLSLLVYATNQDSAAHPTARAWLEQILGGEEAVGLPWVVILGFLRVSTRVRSMSYPLAAEAALAVVDGWLSRPNVIPLGPGEQHWSVLRALLTAAGTAGNLTTDAYIAALAIENDAELCSLDTDFARFPRLRWTNPLATS